MAWLEGIANVPTAWLRSKNLVAFDSDLVLSWFDISGSAHPFDASGVGRPTFKDSDGVSPTGKPYLDFDGATDFMTTAFNMDQLIATTAGTIVMAVQIDAVSTNVATINQNVALFGSNSSAQAVAICLRNNAAKTIYAWHHNGAAGVSVGFTWDDLGIANWNTGWHIIVLRYNNATLEIGVDAPGYLALKSAAITGPAAGLGTLAALGRNYLQTSFFDGRIGEAIFWNARLGDSALAKAVHYMRSEWSGAPSGFMAGPIGDPLEQQRLVQSRRLWFFRENRNSYSIDGLPAAALDVDILTDLAITHPHLLDPAGLGGGGSERAVRCEDIVFDPETFTCSMRVAELRRRVHTYYDSGVAKPTPSQRMNGIALSYPTPAAGGAKYYRGYSRDSKGWCVHPRSGRVTEIGWHQEKLDLAGYLLEQADTGALSENAFVNGLTGWTVTPGAGGAIVAETTSGEFFYDGTTQNCLMSRGTTDNRITVTTGSIGGTANQKGVLSIAHKEAAGVIVGFRLSRTSDGFFWNEGTGAWQAGAVINDFTTRSSKITRDWTRPIDVSVNTTYTIDVRQRAGASADLKAARIYHVQLSMQTTSVHGLLSPIIASGSPIGRNPEFFWAYNGSGNRTFINGGPATFLCYVAPMWKGSEIPAGIRFTVMQVHYNSSANTYWLGWDSTVGGWVFESRRAAVASSATVIHSPDPLRANGLTSDGPTVWYRLAARILNGTLSVFVDGVKGTDVAGVTAPIETAAARMYLGSGIAAIGSERQFNGYMKAIEVLPVALEDREIAAWI